MSNEGNIKASILLILLKYIVVGYSNGNESFTGRLFSNYGSLNKLFHSFQYLIYSVFHETFVKSLCQNYPFSAQISKTHFKMSNFVILKWRPFEGKKLMGLLLLKLRAVELEGRTESRLLITNWLCKLSIWFWTATSGKWLVVRRHHSDVFNVIFEISRHLFPVFLLLTLNNVFFLGKYVVSKVT